MMNASCLSHIAARRLLHGARETDFTGNRNVEDTVYAAPEASTSDLFHPIKTT
jgi:hypothetical protein